MVFVFPYIIAHFPCPYTVGDTTVAVADDLESEGQGGIGLEEGQGKIGMAVADQIASSQALSCLRLVECLSLKLTALTAKQSLVMVKVK